MANTTQRNPQKAQRAKPTKASTMKAAKTNKKDRKRVTAESDEDEYSDNLDSRVKKKQRTKQQRKVSDDDSDIDVISDDVEPAPQAVENVDIESGVGNERDEQEVSAAFSL